MIIGTLIGSILGAVIFLLVVFPLLEKYGGKIIEWYSKYLEKWGIK